ncbi:unnamed protein product [Caenorhabditis angaria]|uniref:Coatomer alpha subunit C-terminal domain-containing protein n=1 Tax=Caenorhabditis angaria TaxID=860376 RepID=A0A9P1N0C8_9PELO|nr:unnamed protein product [Caenorhabditis angaria]
MEHIANKSQFETIIKLIRGTYYWGEWSMENDQFHLVKMSSEQLDCQGSKLIVLMEESLKNLIGVIKIDPNICYEDNSKFVDKCMQVCDHYELIIEMHQDTGSTLFNSDETVRNPTLLSAIERRETVQPIEQQIGQIDKEEFYASLVDRTMSVEQKLEQKLNQNSEMDRLKKLFNQKATIAEKMDIVRMLKKADWTLEDMVYVDLKPRLGNNIFDKLWYVWRFESDETFRRKLIDLSTDYIISVDLLKIIAPMYNEQLYDDVNFWLDKLSSETNSSKIVDEIRALRREKREEKQKNEKKPKKEKRNSVKSAQEAENQKPEVPPERSSTRISIKLSEKHGQKAEKSKNSSKSASEAEIQAEKAGNRRKYAPEAENDEKKPEIVTKKDGRSRSTSIKAQKSVENRRNSSGNLKISRKPAPEAEKARKPVGRPRSKTVRAQKCAENEAKSEIAEDSQISSGKAENSSNSAPAPEIQPRNAENPRTSAPGAEIVVKKVGRARSNSVRAPESAPEPEIAPEARNCEVKLEISENPQKLTENVVEVKLEIEENEEAEYAGILKKFLYDENNPFVICSRNFVPLYRGQPLYKCSFCRASYSEGLESELCVRCLSDIQNWQKCIGIENFNIKQLNSFQFKCVMIIN